MTATQTSTTKRRTYGVGIAVMILVAQEMGLDPQFLDKAKKVVAGESIHPMDSAAMETAATRINNSFNGDAEKVAKANSIATRILAENGYA